MEFNYHIFENKILIVSLQVGRKKTTLLRSMKLDGEKFREPDKLFASDKDLVLSLVETRPQAFYFKETLSVQGSVNDIFYMLQSYLIN